MTTIYVPRVIESVEQAEEETEPAGGIDILHGGRHEWPARRRCITPWEELA